MNFATAYAATASKAAKAPKARGARAVPAASVIYPRTLAASWLVKDAKALLDGVRAGADLQAVATTLQREPMSVLRYLAGEDIQPHLERLGLDFDCPPGSEEEVELLGLALCGVPLAMALHWCRGDGAPAVTHAAVLAAMTSPDLRPAFALARELKLWVVQADQVPGLRALAAEPRHRVDEAVAMVLCSYESLTPNQVAQVLFMAAAGAAPAREAPYPWGAVNVVPTSLPKLALSLCGSGKRGKSAKSTKATKTEKGSKSAAGFARARSASGLSAGRGRRRYGYSKASKASKASSGYGRSSKSAKAIEAGRSGGASWSQSQHTAARAYSDTQSRAGPRDDDDDAQSSTSVGKGGFRWGRNVYL